MQVVTAVEKFWLRDEDVSVFLAGGITNCPDWQQAVIAELKRMDAEHGLEKLVLFNPRRADFPIGDPNASVEQITWEFNELQKMDVFSMYFTGGESDQPICLYELGRNVLRMQRKFPTDFEKRIVISCDLGYRRAEDVRVQMDLAWKEVPRGGEFIDRDPPDIVWKNDPADHARRIAKAYEYALTVEKGLR